MLLGLALLMLVTAWWRKRLFLGITMALYGLAIFNLHYWGFGIPYILAAAWLPGALLPAAAGAARGQRRAPGTRRLPGAQAPPLRSQPAPAQQALHPATARRTPPKADSQKADKPEKKQKRAG